MVTPDEYRMAFACRFERLMKACGYPKHVIAKRSGLTESMLDIYAQARAIPTAFTAAKLAIAMEVDANELLGIRKQVSE